MRFWAFLMSLLALFGIEESELPSMEAESFDPQTAVSESYEQAQGSELFEVPEAKIQPDKSAAPAGRLPVYGDYDDSAFYDMCRELEELAAGHDAQAVCQQYDRLYEEFLLVDTRSTVAYLNYSANVLDETLMDNSAAADSLWGGTAAALCDAGRAVMNGPCAQAFRAHVGDRAADYFASYSSGGDRQSELLDRETALENEYYETLALSEQYSYRYDGRDWTMELLYGSAGDQFYEEDYDGYFEVYYALLEQVNASLGPIFLELVAVRDEYAELLGYDSYADYAYECLYGRDYSCDDAQAFCDAVKRYVSRDYYDHVYYNDLSTDGFYSVGHLDEEKILEILGQYASEIDPLVAEGWELMMENELYDIGEGSRRMDTAYTINLSRPSYPYIFMTMSGGAVDFSTMTHEFGHFLDGWLNPSPNVITESGSFDLFEIHSNGLEVLYLEYYPEIFGDAAEAAEFAVLGDQLGSIVDGCLFDEFQRRIYDEPDMSLQEVNELYAQLCIEYGEYDGEEEDHFWVYISHNFDSPLYYISYAASALAALQIWDESRQDYDAGVDSYLEILRIGGYEDSYMQVLRRAGMKSFAETGAVEQICRPVLNHLRDIG